MAYKHGVLMMVTIVCCRSKSAAAQLEDQTHPVPPLVLPVGGLYEPLLLALLANPFPARSQPS